jgi:MFS transporter, ACS family, hexuronate transporter
VLERFGGDYTPIFVIAGSAYLVALTVVHLINPPYAPVTKFARAAE